MSQIILTSFAFYSIFQLRIFSYMNGIRIKISKTNTIHYHIYIVYTTKKGLNKKTGKETNKGGKDDISILFKSFWRNTGRKYIPLSIPWKKVAVIRLRMHLGLWIRILDPEV